MAASFRQLDVVIAIDGWAVLVSRRCRIDETTGAHAAQRHTDTLAPHLAERHLLHYLRAVEIGRMFANIQSDAVSITASK